MATLWINITTADAVHYNEIQITDELIQQARGVGLETVREAYADTIRIRFGAAVEARGVIQFEAEDGKWVIFPASRLIEVEVTSDE